MRNIIPSSIIAVLGLATVTATAAAPPELAPAAPIASAGAGLTPQAVMRLPAPPVLRFRARDGASLAYRFFPPALRDNRPETVAVLLHGSAGSSLNMPVLGAALAGAGVPAFAPDVRGQGLSGRRGDIDYIGQQDDDLTDLVQVVRKAYPDARLVLVGHSSGGGFALRIAGEPQGRSFRKFVLLAPVLGRMAPTNRPDAGWARPHYGRIVLLEALNGVGVSGFNSARAVDFNVPAGAGDLGLTGSWSYRMMSNYGPRGQTQLFGPPAYRADAAHSTAPIVVVAGAADALFYADRYASAFAGLKRVSVEVAAGVDHMGVVSDPRAVPLIVAAVTAID
jgi:alpha-beta hydrolase superfamily lysophospholipase